jgi:hypothetical protein
MACYIAGRAPAGGKPLCCELYYAVLLYVGIRAALSPAGCECSFQHAAQVTSRRCVTPVVGILVKLLCSAACVLPML